VRVTRVRLQFRAPKLATSTGPCPHDAAACDGVMSAVFSAETEKARQIRARRLARYTEKALSMVLGPDETATLLGSLAGRAQRRGGRR
jgi:hypothetical protein